MAKSAKSVTQTGRRRSQPQALNLYITLYGEFDGVGMGRLSDDSVYLTQRGLARLCGVQNAHIGTISADWDSDKPRIRMIKARLQGPGEDRLRAHRALSYKSRTQYCYDMAVCQAILAYYAFDAGRQVQSEAERNLTLYDPSSYDGAGLSGFINHGLSVLAHQPKAEAVVPLRFQPTQIEPQPLAETSQSSDAVADMIRAYYDLSFLMAQAYVAWMSAVMQRAAWNNRLGLYVPLRAFLSS